MKITEINYTTNPETITTRDATPAELAQWEYDQAAQLERDNEIKNKEAARASALSKLAALGLSADEVKAILD